MTMYVRRHLRYLHGLWGRFLARHRLSLRAVCQQSAGKGMVDYHDYHDDELGSPDHFLVMQCKRCGKLFTI